LTPDHLLTAIEKSQNSGASIKFSDKISHWIFTYTVWPWVEIAWRCRAR
jgi:hypothetical protein